jgi:hypothetical protein
MEGRRRASESRRRCPVAPAPVGVALLLPGNDFWSFDGETVVFTHLSGDGAVQGYELTTDSVLVSQCLTAFEAAWSAAIPHSEYTPS